MDLIGRIVLSCLLGIGGFLVHPKYIIAADIWIFEHHSGSYNEIVIEGIVEEGDFDRFIELAWRQQGKLNGVRTFSSGGDFYEAMKIGRAIRKLELVSSVPHHERDSWGRPSCEPPMEGLFPRPKDSRNCTCASACFFVHLGGSSRMGTYLAVHRPYFAVGRFGSLPSSEAKLVFDKLQEEARNYMIEMGVPAHIQEDVLATPSSRTMVLDENVVRTHFLGSVPYYEEWLRNKCSRVSRDDEARLSQYAKVLQEYRSRPTDRRLSPEELEDYRSIKRMKNQELTCKIVAIDEQRMEAYKEYFNKRVSLE